MSESTTTNTTEVDQQQQPHTSRQRYQYYNSSSRHYPSRRMREQQSRSSPNSSRSYHNDSNHFRQNNEIMENNARSGQQQQHQRTQRPRNNLPQRSQPPPQQFARVYHHGAQRQDNGLASTFAAQMNLNNGTNHHHARNRPNHRANHPRSNVPKKSQEALTLPNNKNESQHEIMDELLRQAEYECIICCEGIGIHDKTWNCNNCFNVLHLKCARSWATKCSNDKIEGDGGNGGEQASTSGTETNNARRRNDRTLQSEEWRCPTCQDVKKQIPANYYCFCGKRKNPESNHYHVPHSCGDVCGRALKLFNKPTESKLEETASSCVHLCTLKCHPGKCPPCQLKIMQSCACKQTKVYVNCSVGVSEIKCQQTCGKLLDCGNDHCTRNCHFGPCEPCDKQFQVSCKCAKSIRDNVSCKQRAASFTCNEPCEKTLACGFHKCTRSCHTDPCGACPFDPSLVKHCPCGKTLLSSLASARQRVLCTDPIPNCFNICEKRLECSNEKETHVCKSICHSGVCPPCLQSTIMRCECGANTHKFECKDLHGKKSWNCQRRCNKKLSCGRHKCLNLCCTDKEHLCHNPCRRKLSCGQHLCDEPCHTNCGACPNLIWEEVTCNCGDKVLYPPLPCNTKKPLCDLLCPRDHGCGHPPKHSCTTVENQQLAHQPPCPPCNEFVGKMCFGEHEMRYSTPCYQTQISCGRFCLKPIDACGHVCNKICHEGPCRPCTSKCKRTRVDCDHLGCGKLCHSDEIQCWRVKCVQTITVFCECEFKTETRKCHEVNNASTKDSLRQSLMNKFSFNTAVGMDEISHMVEYKVRHPLQCDDKCAKEKRSKQLAEAFGCERTLAEVKYSGFLKAEAKKNPQFIKNLQDKFAALIISFYKNDQKPASHSFPSMNKQNREVIHHLAPFYGLASQSFDREPNRNVIVTANQSSKLPEVTLLESVNLAHNPVKINLVKAMTSSQEQQSSNKKTIDYFNYGGGDD